MVNPEPDPKKVVAVTLPVADINPAVVTLPAMTLPVTELNPVTVTPTLDNTHTLDVPFTAPVRLPLV